MPRKQTPPEAQQFQLIPLELIDPPARPIRESFDQEAMEELVQSIRSVGVLQPITVEEHDGRYRIIAGHRRYLAAGRAGLKAIPALIRDTRQLSAVAVTAHENAFREDVNPAEEAVYLSQLLENEAGGDVDRLCQITRLSRNYVETRLQLLRGDPDVFEAVRQRRISMAVARELNKVKDRGYRMMYLDAAIRGGATARTVMEWRIQSEAIAAAEPPQLTPAQAPQPEQAPVVTSPRCIFCDSDDEAWNMDFVPMHRRCRHIFFDRIVGGIKAGLAAAFGGGTDAPES
jgi:ParB/RepB/Spo0J family partition protein